MYDSTLISAPVKMLKDRLALMIDALALNLVQFAEALDWYEFLLEASTLFLDSVLVVMLVEQVL